MGIQLGPCVMGAGTDSAACVTLRQTQGTLHQGDGADKIDQLPDYQRQENLVGCAYSPGEGIGCCIGITDVVNGIDVESMQAI